MANANSITLILDHKPHAVQLARLLKENSIDYELLRPAGEADSFKFVFNDPGDFLKGEINNMIDEWNSPER